MQSKSMPFYKVIHRTVKYGYEKLPGYFWIYIVTCVAMSTFNFISIQILQKLFDTISNVYTSGIWDQVMSVIIIIGIVFIISRSIKGFQVYFNKIYFMTFINKILKDMNAKAGRLRLLDFESLQLYDKINMAIGGVNCAIKSTIDLLNGLIYYSIFLISVGIYLFSIKPMLLVLCVFIFLPKLLSQVIKGAKLYQFQDSVVACERQSNYYKKCLVDKTFYKETKTLGAVSYFIKCYRDKINEYNDKKWSVQVKIALIDCGLTLITYIGYIGSFGLLTFYLLDGSISIGHFSAIFYSLNKLMDTMKEMVELFGTIYENANLAGKLYDYLELPEEKGENEEIVSIETLRLENVSFHYPYDNKNALENISLEIQKGSHVAIVGVNGSGKTTLVKILMGLFRPTEGKIYINKKDTSNWSTESITKNVSAVFQNYGKYKLTLRENVMLSDIEKKVDDEEIRNKMEEAGFDYQREDISNQLDKMLSKEFNGIDLSGGEWQRLAIARGIYRKNDMIVLDEPTAAIDPIEEANVYSRFDEISKGKTVLVVTHRLGSVKSADRIIVLKGGKIIEDGSHNALMIQNGFYAKMFLTQAEWYQRKGERKENMI